MRKKTNPVDTSKLVSGNTYIIVTADWTSPYGEVIRGMDKLRKFFEIVTIGNVVFLDVESPSGRRHLICTNNIALIKDATGIITP